MHRDHRKRLLELLREHRAAAVVPTAPLLYRNADSEHRFRPDSDFWYLTGFAEPESALVLLPDRAAGEPESVLFLRERDAAKEVWTGRRLGVEQAPAALGVDAAYPIEELWTKLPELLSGYERIVYRTGQSEARDRRFLGLVSDLRARARRGLNGPAELLDVAPLLHEMRLFKSKTELEVMRRAAAITSEAHAVCMAAARPGIGEHELDALLHWTFRRRGATGAAYTNIVAGGANACILHYVENDRPIADGDLVLIDAGAEVDYYASDVTRTFPINGTFSAEQRAIYDVVLAAQEASIDAVAPGREFDDYHEVAVRVLVEGLCDLGLLPGSADEAIESESYKRFYMHRTGHWLGLDVHDCGAYARDGASRKLEPGMVLTVEPGLYVAPDDETVDARWRGIGVRIEDDVLVTAAGREVLTADIPKSVADVEAACHAERLEPVAP